jgi:hypothetical protein
MQEVRNIISALSRIFRVTGFIFHLDAASVKAKREKFGET